MAIALFCLTLPVMTVLASKGVVPLLYVCTLLACLLQFHVKRSFPPIDKHMALAVAVFLLWAAVSSAWSPDPSRGLLTIVKLAPLYAAGFLLVSLAVRLAEQDKQRVLRFLAVGWFLAFSVVLVEITFHYPISGTLRGLSESDHINLSRLNRGVTALTLLVWPLAALKVGRARGWPLIVPLCLLIYLLPQTEASAAVLALIVGLLGLGLAIMHPKMSHIILIASFVGFFVLAPVGGKVFYEKGLVDANWVQMSARHRSHIWNFTVDRFLEKPVLGWGFDASSQMDNAGAPPFSPRGNNLARDAKRATEGDAGQESPKVSQNTRESLKKIIPSHPHNAALQILMETGLVGTFLVACILFLVYRRATALPSFIRPFCTAQILGVLAVAGTAYGIWQSQWQTIILSAALTLALTKPPDSHSHQD